MLSNETIDTLIECANEDTKINEKLHTSFDSLYQIVDICRNYINLKLADQLQSLQVINEDDDYQTLFHQRNELSRDMKSIKDIIDDLPDFNSNNLIDDYVVTPKETIKITTKIKTCPECYYLGEFPMIPRKLKYNILQNNQTVTDNTTVYKCHKCDSLFLHREAYHEIIRKYPEEDINLDFQFTYCRPSRIMYYDFLVISNIKHCSREQHKICDITASLEIIAQNGEIESVELQASYCNDCDRFVILKSDFNKLEGIPNCLVIDETVETNYNGNYPEILSDEETKFKQRGYNVNCNANLPTKQRQAILKEMLRQKDTTKSEIFSYLDTLIQRGRGIPSWSTAVTKWEEDRAYVETIEVEKITVGVNSITKR